MIDKNLKNRETEFWNKRRREKEIQYVAVNEVENIILSPCYESGNDRYSDNKKEFHEKYLQKQWKNKHVLDYACGYGNWAIYYALSGAEKVSGFDISEVSIKIGNDLVNKQGLKRKVNLSVMDASDLQYDDNVFDLIIGHGALHHVIKYPNIFEELYRVMKPGAKAYFLEGLADFPIWKLYWYMKGPVPDGDVPIFSKEIMQKAEMFSNVEINGDNFIYTIKTLLWKKNMGHFRRNILKYCKKIDEKLFYLFPKLRQWGSFSYIILQK
jgi:ubiquinone/menaquinone biosynthesis C-methylase UbiE